MTTENCIEIRLSGEQGSAVAVALAERLRELGRAAEVCESRVLLEVSAEDRQSCGFDLLPQDPPEFAAEKILDALAEQGIITLEPEGLSAHDEARIEDRLRRLGYLE